MRQGEILLANHSVAGMVGVMRRQVNESEVIGDERDQSNSSHHKFTQGDPLCAYPEPPGSCPQAHNS